MASPVVTVIATKSSVGGIVVIILQQPNFLNMKTISTLKKAFGILTCSAMFAASAQTTESGGHSSGSPAGFGTATIATSLRSSQKAGETNLFKGELYGSIVSSADWTSSSRHPGLYRINQDLSKDQLMENFYMTGSAGVYIRGKMYFANGTNYGNIVVQNTLMVFDIDNLKQEGGYAMPTNMANIAVGYAYDRMADKAYAITYNAQGSGFVLNNFNYEKRSYSPICSISETFFALTFTPDGTLYGINNKGTVKSISLTDGKTTDIVETGLTPSYVQSAAWSPKDKAIIWTATLSDGTGQIIKIDPVAKTSEKIQDFNHEVVGLYTNDIITVDGAPAQPHDVEISYQQPGTNQATVTFTMPSLTVDGQTLSGNLDTEIVVDGDFESSTSASAKVGATCSIDIDMKEAGSHKIAVYVKNATGKCQPVITKAFAGYDTPQAVTDLCHELTNEGGLTLTWSPSKALNNGYIGTVTYHISRNGIEIATTDETSFSETLGNDLKIYSYTVTPVANGKKGESVSTESFTFGETLSLPYSQNFSTPDAFLLFIPVDANEDGNTWKLSDWTKCAVYQRGDIQADDYLVAPPFHAEAHHTYTLAFDTYLDYQSNPEEISVLVADGRSLTALRSGKTLLEKESITNTNQDKRRIEVEYTPDTDGIKHFAWLITSDPSCFKLNISNVEIKDLGNIKSPKAVEDLSVVSGKNGSLKAVVSFTVPSTTLNGNPISKLNRMELSRDGNFIRAFNNVDAGQKIEYEDEVDSPAFYEYSIVGINDNGAGDAAVIRQYIGGYDCPATFLDDSGKSDFRNFTVIDGNDDNCQWRWDEEQQAAKYVQDAAGYASDYLFSPMVYMESGKVYEISYEAHVTEGSLGFVLFTKLSNTLTTNNILTFYPAQVVHSDSTFERITKFIEVPENGYYAVAVAVEENMNAGQGIYIKNISVKEGPDPGTPAAVDNIKAEPAAKGELKATLRFKLPDTNIMGTAMGSDMLLGAKVYDNNGDLCGEVPMQYHPNDSVKMEVNALQGINRFTVYATNDKGQGNHSSVAAFCGIDTPFRVYDIYSNPSTDNMSTTLKWSVPTEGSHGGWFNTDELEYHIYMMDEEGNKVLLAKTHEREYTFNAYDNTLRKYTLGVIPSTKAGMGTQIHTVFSQLGKPYAVPFEETFADATYASGPWIQTNTMQSSSWDLSNSTEDIPSEDDGFVFFNDKHNSAAQGRLYLPKVSLENVPDALLKISTWQYYQAKAQFRVFVSTDDNNFDFIGTCYSDNVTEFGNNRWNTWTFDLKPYAYYKWIQIYLDGTLSNNYYGAIDDIRITSDLLRGVEEADMDSGIKVSGTFDAIEILGGDGRLISVYGVDGRTVYQGIPDSGRFRIPALKGIYVVIADGRRIGKAVVK